MGGAVFTDKTGPVDSEYDREFLKTYIVNDLVIGTLQKGRIYGNNRP